MPENERLRVFLCHASKDKPRVKELYDRLIADGVDAWLDSEKLIPGQNWDSTIQEAIKSSHIFIPFLTNNFVSKEGYLQKEVKIALDVALEKLEGTIYIVPVKLEDCPVPRRLSEYHWANLESPDGYDKLLSSLWLRAEQLGINIKPENNTNAPPLENGVLLPEGAILYYEDHRTSFNALEAFILDDINSKFEASDWSTPIEMQHTVVGGSFSTGSLISMVSDFMLAYPSVQFLIQYLVVDPKYLHALTISTNLFSWGDSAERTILTLKNFLETTHLKWGNRLDFSIKSIKSLPEKTGTLLNSRNLFLTDVDFNFDSEQPAQIRIRQDRYYFSIKDLGGQRQISLFKNRFKFYWDFESTTIYPPPPK